MSKQMMVARADVRSAIHAMGDEFKKVLPEYLTPDRLMRVAMTSINRNPGLLQCTEISLISALMTCAELGLEPDGQKAYMIPFGDHCKLVVGYKGYVQLVLESGMVTAIHADVVRQKDEFSYNLGVVEYHRIDYRQPRGEIYAVYAVVRLRDGTTKAEVMSVDEVEAVRQGSPGRNSDPWRNHWPEMAKKTAFRRLVKWLKLSPELDKAIGVDGDNYPPLAQSAPQSGQIRAHSQEAVSPVIPGAEIVIDEEFVESESEPESRSGAKPSVESPPKGAVDEKPESDDAAEEELLKLIIEGRQIVGDNIFVPLAKAINPDAQRVADMSREEKEALLKRVTAAADAKAEEETKGGGK